MAVLERSDFTVVSANGVPAPAPSRGLLTPEATSPARRSPQVRAAQRLNSRRPDLLAKQPADIE